MKKKYILIGIISLIVLCIIGFIVYVSDYYKAIDIDNYLSSSEIIKVEKKDDGYFFDGPGTDNLIIMYPGAKVEYTSYAQLLYNLAGLGIDSYIVKMPFNIAFFGKNKANNIINNYKYENYYVMGHSLGGVVLSSFVNNRNDISGIIFLASYPNNEINIKSLSIYGDNDKALNIKKYNEAKKYFSNNNTEFVIKGGNHSGFASYGEQKGDGERLISNNDQINLTIQEILKFINNE